MALYWNETGHLLVHVGRHDRGAAPIDADMQETFAQMSVVLAAMARAWDPQITAAGFWA